MTNKTTIGRYFENTQHIIYIESIHNDYIYSYLECNVNDNGEIVLTNIGGYITPNELKHYEEV